MPSETSNEFIAGACGGLVGLVVGHPCDTMKTVTQNSDRAHSMRQLGRTMTSLGAATFFRGLSVPLWSYAVVNSVFFGANKTLGKHLGVEPDADSPQHPSWFHLPSHQYVALIASGAVAGAIQLVPAIPVEVIKVRMQKNAHTGGPRPLVRTTVANIYAQKGLRGFYTGGMAQFMRDVPASASYFFTYELTRRFLRRHTDWSDLSNSLVAGAFGGWVSWILPLPQDVIKTRLQSGRDKDIRSCVRSMWAEGPRAFFKGMGLVSVRAFLVNGVTFWGYEVAIQFLRRQAKEAESEEEERQWKVEATPVLSHQLVAAASDK